MNEEEVDIEGDFQTSSLELVSRSAAEVTSLSLAPGLAAVPAGRSAGRSGRARGRAPLPALHHGNVAEKDQNPLHAPHQISGGR